LAEKSILKIAIVCGRLQNYEHRCAVQLLVIKTAAMLGSAGNDDVLCIVLLEDKMRLIKQ
jgi:hypothetical protein